MIIRTADEIGDVLALASEIATVEGVTRREGLRRAVHQWTALQLDIEADLRYMPAGEMMRPHVSIAAVVPELEVAA